MRIKRLKHVWFMTVLLSSGMFFFSCGPPYYFLKPNTTSHDFLKDEYECSREVSQYMYNIQLYEGGSDYDKVFQEQWCECMGIKNWKYQQSKTPCKGCFKADRTDSDCKGKL
ncbi:MAG: hypothetical protein M1491_05720 [Deltaproteobacteria bacterium]|nr:hypothetical protein [Deltaproteobacteria bacterium]MCL5276367.1 hypothetical protein [Deltaproteobacteria bacterium]